nr:MAG TPA: hypothetical protein [Caudoviricetes sp.]
MWGPCLCTGCFWVCGATVGKGLDFAMQSRFF